MFYSVSRGYIGIQKECDCIATVLRRNMKERKRYPRRYWYEFNAARGQVEASFADLFHSKFRFISRWTGKSKTTFIDFSANLLCCVILYNLIKRNAL